MERAIMLSLEKAKEFYAKGGEFRDLALGAYTEEELTKVELPKTWGEFCRTHDIMPTEAYICSRTSTTTHFAARGCRDIIEDRNMLPSREAAEAHLALMQLHQLRDCYRKGWLPGYDDDTPKYSIHVGRFGVTVAPIYRNVRFLTFQEEETAVKFSERFADLIKKAGDLI